MGSVTSCDKNCNKCKFEIECDLKHFYIWWETKGSKELPNLSAVEYLRMELIARSSWKASEYYQKNFLRR